MGIADINDQFHLSSSEDVEFFPFNHDREFSSCSLVGRYYGIIGHGRLLCHSSYLVLSNPTKNP